MRTNYWRDLHLSLSRKGEGDAESIRAKAWFDKLTALSKSQSKRSQ